MLSETDRAALIREMYPEVAEACESVIRIVAYAGDQSVTRGSGVVVGRRKVLTAQHVIEGAERLLLYTHAEGRKLATEFSGTITVADIQEEKVDVAMFSLPKILSGIVPPGKTASTNGEDLEFCFLLGFPNVSGEFEAPLYGQRPIIMPAFYPKVEKYDLSYLLPAQFVQDFGGSSGGALVNQKGEVIGIHHSGCKTEDNSVYVGFATDLRSVRFNLTQMLKWG